jgi:hypothetical protein
MSIKHLFGKSFKQYASASSDVESSAYIDNTVKERLTYLPPINFASASNFVKYGSAKLYYSNSIKRIYSDYPYDGSKSEKIQFHQSSSYLDRWMFEQKYPKTTGHITLGTTGYQGLMPGNGYGRTTTNEYVRVWGGIHTASAGMEDRLIRETFEQSGKYDLTKNRTQNWRCDPVSGLTIEFWLKIPDWNLTSTGTERQVILHLNNGQTVSAAGGGSLVLEIHRSSANTGTFQISMKDGQAVPKGPTSPRDISNVITDSFFAEWHHYAVTVKNGPVGLDTTFYIDGQESKKDTHGSATLEELPGLLTGFIGALQTMTPNLQGNIGQGKLSGSLDEFRYWKTPRSSRQIKLNWFRQIGGGMNTDDNVQDLGVYFKFNEGVVGTSATDSIVLDYSGRIANGLWVGYDDTTNARSTNSGIDLSSYNFTESKDPIIYSEHSDVQALLTEMETSGSNYDSEYQGSLYNSFPTWILEEDNDGNQNLKKLSQILASYFDTLHAQITALSNLKNKEYVLDTYKPSPFTRQLLEEKGFITKDLFIDSTIYELFDGVNLDSVDFEKQMDQIKNLIYLNIYNNLEAIYKSKGTENSIRNALRCFGIDDEIIKLNMYTDGGTHYFTDKTKSSSVKKKFIDFDDVSYFEGTVYQTSSANNSMTFISGGTNSLAENNAFTLEADILVPYKKQRGEIGYYETPFLSSSIFGFHAAIDGDPADYTWATANTASIGVWLVRDEIDSKDARFVIKSADETINLSSGYFEDIYDDNYWNLAIRVKPDTYPYAGNVTNTAPSYTLDFYAVNHNFDNLENEVQLRASMTYESGSAFLMHAKRVYAGAHYTNFTGSLIEKSDIELGGVRAWLDYIGDSSIQQHNKDPFNFGNSESYRESSVFIIDNKQIPSQELTILNWDFDTVTGSNSSSEFLIDDITSGSTDTIYGWVDDIVRRENKGVGKNFTASDTQFVDNHMMYALRKELPEISFTSDNVFIKTERDINFIKDDDVSDNFYMLEKSMNQVVSEEMLKIFSTVHDFSNLIGNPADRYRLSYKKLDKVRQNFFNNVETDLDQEKFITYYKWIDQSISEMINQLFPASVNHSDGVTDVIESHILERNKYQRRVGLLDTVESTEGVARGRGELAYNWKYGHAPQDNWMTPSNNNCLWRKERQIRTDLDPDANDQERLRKVINDVDDISGAKFLQLLDDGTTIERYVYTDYTYAPRKLNKPYQLKTSVAQTIHGGINYNTQKNRDYYKSLIQTHGPIDATGAPRNIVGIGIGVGDGINERQKCDDDLDPNKKSYYDATVLVGSFAADSSGYLPHDDSASYAYKVKASNYWPMNLKSGSVGSGYNKFVEDNFRSTCEIVNLHSDTTDFSNEIPMQGPFTQTHVGGHQGRHVNLNRYDTSKVTLGGGAPTNNIDDKYTRPEAYRLLIGDNPHNTFTPDGAMGIVGPDYGGPYPNTERKWAIYYREGRTKSPLNIKNIQTTTTSPVLGNYQHNYEVVSTAGQWEQRSYLRELNNLTNPGAFGDLFNSLPQTTQALTYQGSPQTMQVARSMLFINDLTASHGSFTLNNTRLEITDQAGLMKRYYIQQGVSSTPTGLVTISDGLEYVWIQLSGLLTVQARADQIIMAITGSTGHNGTIQATKAMLRTDEGGVILSLNVPGLHEGIGSITVNSGSSGITPLRLNGVRAIPDLVASFDNTKASFWDYGNAINMPKPTQNLRSNSIITNRFSSPGDKTTMTLGYLDGVAGEFSVYNNLNYRNLSVRGNNPTTNEASGNIGGSGEIYERQVLGDIKSVRVNSHSNRRESLKTLLTRHCGKFGIDSVHGAISTQDYVAEASFYKQHRNSLTSPRIIDETLLFKIISTNATTGLKSSIFTDGSPPWPNSGGVCYSFMIKRDPGGTLGTIFQTFSGGTTAGSAELCERMELNSSEQLIYEVRVDSGNYIQWASSSPILSVGDWYFMIFKWSGDWTEKPQVFVDGVEKSIGPPAQNGSPSGNIRAMDSVTFFGERDSVGSLLGGLANFAVWKRALTASEMTTLYNVNGNIFETSFWSTYTFDFWKFNAPSSVLIGAGIPPGTTIPSDLGITNLQCENWLTASAGLGETSYVTQDQPTHNNMYVSTPIPASDFQYSWINQVISGSDGWISDQPSRGILPRSGKFTKTIFGRLVEVDAINFPLISAISGSI